MKYLDFMSDADSRWLIWNKSAYKFIELNEALNKIQDALHSIPPYIECKITYEEEYSYIRLKWGDCEVSQGLGR